jgi:uncharacterized membrane protein YkvA (DUF1232 family)
VTVKTLEEAQVKAKEYLGSRTKMSRLLSACSSIARRNYEALLAPWESLQILLRMVRAWLCGWYVPSTAALIGGIAAIVYFVDPFDLIPDNVPVFGFLDDAAVIAAVVRMNLTEISRFRNWETSLSRQRPPQD